MALPAHAGDPPKLALSGSAWLTTDYMFRSISNTSQNPAAQVEFDATYGILYGYVWGSNTEFGENIELDYGLGITPKWGNVTFNFAALYYTYPGASDIDYFEALGGATWTSGAWTLGFKDYWSPDNFQFFDESNAIEGSIAYAFSGKLFNFFSPIISGAVGRQWYEEPIPDYTYWNAGLTLGFLDHWSADIRYYDTADYSQTDCFNLIGNRNSCDARAVGTIKATF